MNVLRLTNLPAAATTHDMRLAQERAGRWKRRGIRVAGVLLACPLALGGCVSVNAPDKPIVIELNINIKQEVIYRLAADAGNTIENNPDIF